MKRFSEKEDVQHKRLLPLKVGVELLVVSAGARVAVAPLYRAARCCASSMVLNRCSCMATCAR
jgi:hypothetical protein